MEFKKRHLLGIEDLDRDNISFILETAASFKEVSQRLIKKVPTLRGRSVVLIFYEPSTRTRVSFEMAAKRLSADTFSLSKATSSVTKGETLLDTAKNVEAMAPDLIVIRHPAAGAPHFLAQRLSCGVINAGDGAHEHPSQALLDMLTVKEHLGRIEGLKIVILGDISHSRVARSNILGFTRMGARVVVSGPATMIPPGIENLGAQVDLNPDRALEGADVVMALRIQKERQDESLFPTLREYSIHYGVNLARLKRAKEGALVMHPGPINRGVELDPAVADGPYSVILDQVANGVAVRMALLFLLMGGGKA